MAPIYDWQCTVVTTVVTKRYITNLTKKWIFAILDVQLRRLAYNR